MTAWFEQYKTARQHDKSVYWRVNQGHRGGNTNIIKSTSSSSTRSFLKSSNRNESSSWSPFHARSTMHQPSKHMPRSFLQPSSTTMMDNAPFFHFCLATIHPTTKCPGIPPKLHITLSSAREATLPAISRSPRWSVQNTQRNCPPPRTKHSTSNRRWLITADDNQSKPQRTNYRANWPVVRTPKSLLVTKK